jgi:hypothetical protein
MEGDMTLMVHKLLDVLRRHPNADMALDLINDVDDKHTLQNYNAVRTTLELAEKFDFGELALEYEKDSKFGPMYKLPELTTTELNAWYLGLVPLPAPICWFEFTMQGHRTGIAVVDMYNSVNDVVNGWSVMRLDYSKGDSLHLDGVWATLDRDDNHHMADIDGFKDRLDPDMHVSIHGNKPWRDLAAKKGMDVTNMYGSTVGLAVYLALMLNSKTTEKKAEPAPAKLNKHRVASKQTPLAAHTIVRIVPVQYLRERRKEAGLTKLPPRMHWRRSHLRTMPHKTPMAKEIAGEWKILIPRILVSKGEAEVSHEYRFVGPT